MTKDTFIGVQDWRTFPGQGPLSCRGDWVEEVESVGKTPGACLKRVKGNLMIPPNMLRNLVAQVAHS